MADNTKIYITKPLMAPLADYTRILSEVWESKHLTNNGTLVRRLESDLQTLLGTHLRPITVSNGTIAIQVALRALGLESGEILTTPFSWVASTSSILWEGFTPRFVDIDPESFNINVKQLERALTPKCRAILAVHVFSNPCQTEEIEDFAHRHGLKVIYDAAHAFGVSYKGQSIFDWGDVSTTSFHATKVFNTAEGGAVFTRDQELYDILSSIRDFGHNSKREIVRIGTNAKMSELHAAFGLSNLTVQSKSISKRRTIYHRYRQILKDQLQYQRFEENAYNYAYMPVVFSDEEQLLRSLKQLNQIQVFPRRYFCLSLNQLSYLKQKVQCPQSESLSRRILCLPIYPELPLEDVDRIANCLLKSLNS